MSTLPRLVLLSGHYLNPNILVPDPDIVKMNFVSEGKSQEGESATGDELPVDHRPLYNRLKEQKDKKQLEYDEAHKLSEYHTILQLVLVITVPRL